MKSVFEGLTTLEYANGKGTLTITKPVAAGRYSIMLAAGGDTEYSTWKVLPAMLDENVRWRWLPNVLY